MICDKRNLLRTLINSSNAVHLTAYLVNEGDFKKLRNQLIQTLKTTSQNLRSIMSRQKRMEFLKPIQAVLDDPKILGTLRGNIGIFRTFSLFQIMRIPVEVEQKSTLASTFHVKPLLRWLQNDRDFVFVGLEKGAVHLYQGSQHSIRHVDTFLLNREEQSVSLASQMALWGNKSKTKPHFKELTLWLDEWLAILSKTSHPKVFFAGQKKISNSLKFELVYNNIENKLQINSFKTKQLSKICFEIRKIISDEIEKDLAQSILEFTYAQNLDLTESNIFKIAKAAVKGRVKKLMIAGNVKLLGKLNNTTGELVLHKSDFAPEDDCLLDDLAQKVLAHGGKVTIASKQDIPGQHSILALTDPILPELNCSKWNSFGVTA